jgi:hypothetical protein
MVTQYLLKDNIVTPIKNMKYKIIKQAPPDHGFISKKLRQLPKGHNCLVLSLSEKGKAVNNIGSLKRRNNMQFTYTTVGNEFKIWRTN